MDRKTELGEKIAQGFERWKHLQKFGGNDPFQADGAVMNLLRKQIITLKKECETELDGDYPPEYNVDTPAEVKNDYMARSDEIRKNAKKSLKIYEKNPDYLWLAEQVGKMDEEEIKETGIRNVVDFPEALAFFIKTSRLVDMRRHENPERYLASFRRCRERVEEALTRPSKPRSRKAKTELKVKMEKEGNPDTIVLNDPTVMKSNRKTDIPVEVVPIHKKTRVKKEVRASREPSKSQKKEVLPMGQLSMFDIGIV